MSIIYSFLKVISVFITSMAMMFFYPNSAEEHSVLDKENIKLNFTVLSDAHIEGNRPDTYEIFTKILYDVKNTDTKNDALVMLGDNTMNGQHIESIFFYGLEKVIAPSDKIINVAGNHDFGNGEGVYDECLDKFIGYNNAFFDAGLEKAYYSTEVNGYTFIVLANDEDEVNYCYISDEQFSWLEDELEKATADGKPVFVLNHHPAFATYSNGSLNSLMDSFDNVFYFYGHTHWSLSSTTVEDSGKTVYVNLPRVTEVAEDNGEIDMYSGIGMQVEVYEEEVVLRMRNYYEGGWIEDYEFSFDIE